MGVLYHGSYKIVDYVEVWAQPINSDYLKLYQKREEPQVVIEKYIRKEKSLNLRQ